MNDENRKHQLIDPDPVTVAVTVLGAVGSITSILSYIDQVKDRRRKEEFERTEILSELFELTTSIEASLADIETALRKMELFPRVAHMMNGLQINKRTKDGEVPFELGAMELHLPMQQFKDFANTHKRISRGCNKVIRDVYSAIELLYKARVDISEDLHGDLVDLRRNTNKVLRGEMTYSHAYSMYIEITAKAREITEGLKSEFVFGPDNRPNNRGPRLG